MCNEWLDLICSCEYLLTSMEIEIVFFMREGICDVHVLLDMLLNLLDRPMNK